MELNYFAGKDIFSLASGCVWLRVCVFRCVIDMRVHQIILDNRNEEVARDAVKLVLTLLDKLHTDARPFLGRVVDHVLSCINEAAATLASDDSDADERTRAVSRTARCVQAVRRLLAADGSAAKLQNHATAGRGATIKVTVFVNDDYRCPDTETFELLLHSKETLASLRDKACRALTTKSECVWPRQLCGIHAPPS